MAGFNASDYVDVAERIREFYEKYPDGRLTSGQAPQVVQIDGKSYVWYHARAFRSPDDVLPGDGWAAEPVPGPTQFTKDSELMNAETAAWGRAIVALGFSTKKIASQQEVRARQPDSGKPPADTVQVGAAARAKQKPDPIKPSLLTLEERLLELVAAYGLDVPAMREKILAQQQRPQFEEWLKRQIAAAESSLKLREEQEAADREAQVESEPAFVAPTGKRGEKAAA